MGGKGNRNADYNIAQAIWSTVSTKLKFLLCKRTTVEEWWAIVEFPQHFYTQACGNHRRNKREPYNINTMWLANPVTCSLFTPIMNH